VRPTTFYRSDCNELTFFVQDAGEITGARAANPVAVRNPRFVALRHLYRRPRREQTIYRNQFRFGNPVQAYGSFDPEVARPRPAQRSQMRAAPNSLP